MAGTCVDFGAIVACRCSSRIILTTRNTPATCSRSDPLMITRHQQRPSLQPVRMSVYDNPDEAESRNDIAIVRDLFDRRGSGQCKVSFHIRSLVVGLTRVGLGISLTVDHGEITANIVPLRVPSKHLLPSLPSTLRMFRGCFYEKLVNFL